VELLTYLTRQFAYDAWANREVLATIKDLEGVPGNPAARSLHLLAHILSAERLWLERLTQHPQTLPVWPDFNLTQCEIQTAELPKLWQDYLGGLSSPALSTNVSYNNSKGESFHSSIQDVLTHVVLHSAYHRGQIASDMRAAGHTPAYTDFIHAVRQDLIE
jgi:uncharacterized damage-inducible protein DinB